MQKVCRTSVNLPGVLWSSAGSVWVWNEGCCVWGNPVRGTHTTAASQITYSLSKYYFLLSNYFKMVCYVWSECVYYELNMYVLHSSCNQTASVGYSMCPLDVLFRISPQVVGHLGTFQLMFHEYCEFGHSDSFHILFFIYYIVGKYVILGAASCG